MSESTFSGEASFVIQTYPLQLGGEIIEFRRVGRGHGWSQDLGVRCCHEDEEEY